MKVAVDLHIHSCLSPCGDINMTPTNIVNMSLLKGLDIIAITDHNSCENCRAAMKYGQENGLVVVPGMEIQSSEEVHIVTLFKDIESSLEFQKIVYENLPNLKNKPLIFGEQIVMDEEDHVIDYNERLLIGATSLSINNIFSIVNSLEGVAIPAHIDRNSYSIISNLGMVPDDLGVNYIELSKECNKILFFEKYQYLKKYKHLKSSDAHYLGNILERETFFHLTNKSIEDLLLKLK